MRSEIVDFRHASGLLVWGMELWVQQFLLGVTARFKIYPLCCKVLNPIEASGGSRMGGQPVPRLMPSVQHYREM